ncbi:hypothetical protein BGZ99_000436 [Dissophora globulifera]|uniref:Uncharacterized protein n=1 Tax=Dissophora globulifera TaxID=979702 RepID=A0A9P6R3E4_9FUNG|nr:hypothetical protein BGZ99_000436 [Dissophora globulifera]
MSPLTNLQTLASSLGQTLVESLPSWQPSIRPFLAQRPRMPTVGVTGVSCAVQVTANYAHRYSMVVVNTKGTTWRGSLLDTVTSKSTVVGEWTLPQGAGKLINGGTNAVDYYPWNNNENVVCNTLPFTEVSFYGPTSTTKGATGGSWRIPRPVGACVNQVQLNATFKATSYNIKIGFK